MSIYFRLHIAPVTNGLYRLFDEHHRPINWPPSPNPTELEEDRILLQIEALDLAVPEQYATCH